MTSLDDFARTKLDRLETEGLRRRMILTDRFSETGARRGGRDLVSFCCNDYLSLSHHPEVIEAAREATSRYGTGSGGSRLISGNTPLYDTLEATLARWKQTEDCMVFGSGYLTNLGVIPCLAGKGDLIMQDELNHSCLFAGGRISGAAVHTFRHNDVDHARQILRQHRAAHGTCVIAVDGVFSMDGDIAPIDELAALAREYEAWLMTDDAHGLGVVGGGRGSSFLGAAKSDVPLQMGTLSKAIGAYGGYLCASQPVIDLIRNRGRSFVYSTGLPPGTLAAAIKALEIIERDPAMCARPIENAARFCAALGLAVPVSPIVPVILGEARRVMEASTALQERGFLVTGIRPPTVPEGTARLRVTFSAAHTAADIDGLVAAMRELGLAG
ncbi:8-amino-7-oxononanoate synthase [Iodidimonas sp. SYSU 1G8]|uniref:8-amino-7-oxononanoate synthase n=1 Tax=Iodidimonas sp. SYSU 1G8 TaxID=3133967 RepID=UPI0031FE6C95